MKGEREGNSGPGFYQLPPTLQTKSRMYERLIFPTVHLLTEKCVECRGRLSSNDKFNISFLSLSLSLSIYLSLYLSLCSFLLLFFIYLFTLVRPFLRLSSRCLSSAGLGFSLVAIFIKMIITQLRSYSQRLAVHLLTGSRMMPVLTLRSNMALLEKNQKGRNFGSFNKDVYSFWFNTVCLEISYTVIWA